MKIKNFQKFARKLHFIGQESSVQYSLSDATENFQQIIFDDLKRKRFLVL